MIDQQAALCHGDEHARIAGLDPGQILVVPDAGEDNLPPSRGFAGVGTKATASPCSSRASRHFAARSGERL